MWANRNANARKNKEGNIFIKARFMPAVDNWRQGS